MIERRAVPRFPTNGPDLAIIERDHPRRTTTGILRDVSIAGCAVAVEPKPWLKVGTIVTVGLRDEDSVALVRSYGPSGTGELWRLGLEFAYSPPAFRELLDAFVEQVRTVPDAESLVGAVPARTPQ